MLTQQRLKELFYYDENCGEFVRLKKTTNSVNIGDVAGTVNFYGYKQINIDGKIYKNHRLAWLYVYGFMPELHIDHINRNTKDNRISNLRLVTVSQNLQNSKKRTDNTSGYKGVSLHKKSGKWTSRIKICGNYKYLGLFDTKEKAYEAYVQSALKNHSHSIFKTHEKTL